MKVGDDLRGNDAKRKPVATVPECNTAAALCWRLCSASQYLVCLQGLSPPQIVRDKGPRDPAADDGHLAGFIVFERWIVGKKDIFQEPERMSRP
jgi:hypothetical protein